MVNDGIDPSNIVVVLPDENFAKVLALFDDKKYFNFAMGKDIYNSNLFKISQAIYEYISDDEIKNKQNLVFLECDKKAIDEGLFKKLVKVHSNKRSI
ncbi:MAG: hypothetical protein ACNI22_16740 [Halarcobacter sp.]